MGVYEQLGVRTLLNASGTLTRLGGSLMPREVVEAMAEAARGYVRLEELQEAAGREIARVTGAEAGYVTNGAAGGLLLATAACVARLDVSAMDRLPDTTGLRNEVVMQRAHRNCYDHAIRAAGVRIVDVGFPGQGGTRPWQIEAALSERTAAVAHVVGEGPGSLPLAEVVRLAHRHEVPVIVDAAVALPPAENLRLFIAEGADLVVFSGGKALRGPQASGILAGRHDLVESAALQHLDMSVHAATWDYGQRYLDSGLLVGLPHHGLGRVCKVGKEEIVGLVTALRLYERRDHRADQEQWRRQAEYLVSELKDLPHVRLELLTPTAKPLPQVQMFLDEAALGFGAADVVRRLMAGEPRVAVGEDLLERGAIVLKVFSLEYGEERQVARLLRRALLGETQSD